MKTEALRTKLKFLDEVNAARTPGPYRTDIGNGDVESRHRGYWRQTVIERAGLDRADEQAADMRLVHPDQDLLFHEVAGNTYTALLNIARAALILEATDPGSTSAALRAGLLELQNTPELG